MRFVTYVKTPSPQTQNSPQADGDSGAEPDVVALAQTGAPAALGFPFPLVLLSGGLSH